MPKNRKPAPKPVPSPRPPVAARNGKPEPAAPKAPIDRAVRLGRLVDKYSRILYRLVGNWHGEATPDQVATNAELSANLSHQTKVARQVLLDLDMLRESGFAPAAGSSTALPLAAGVQVALTKKAWKPAIYGKTNAFEVVVQIDTAVRIRATDARQREQFVVPRAWLEEVDEVEVDTAPPPDEEEAEIEEMRRGRAPAYRGEERDPRLPNPDED
jgi:hypothetical protein